MALINCDECGHRISDKSIFCPNCGYPTHLNKVLRESRNSGEASTTEKITNTEASHKSEMSDNAVQAALLSSQVKATSDSTSPSASHTTTVKPESDDTVKDDISLQETSPAAAIDEKGTDDAQDALAEYEATLSKPITPEKNNRNKLILYFAVLLALLLAIGGCYYYAKSNHLQSVDEVECEPIEEVLEEEPAVINPGDTAYAMADTLNLPDPAEQQTVVSPSQPTEDTAVDTPSQPAAPQIETSPAVRQL